MSDVFNWPRFHQVPLVGIVRQAGALDYDGLIAAVIAGGLTTIEVSFTFPDAAEQLTQLRKAAGGRLNVGAGTITTLARLDRARAAGASFVVTPALVPEVVAGCRAAGLPVFPGAFTPTEVVAAHAQGAELVKLFPAVSLGPAFVAQLKSALPDVRLLPTGGISLADIPAWKKAGADGLGLGGGLFPSALLQARDWTGLARHIRRHVDAWCSPAPSPLS